MPIPRLNTRRISSVSTSPIRCSSEKIRGASHEVGSTTASAASPITRLRLPGRPPPVMWATEWTGTASMSARTAGA